MKICKLQYCGRKHHAKGYCKKHYARRFRKSRASGIKHNEIFIKGSMAEIVLYSRRGEEKARVIIDTEDIEKVRKYRWRIVKGHAETHQNGNPKFYYKLKTSGETFS